MSYLNFVIRHKRRHRFITVIGTLLVLVLGLSGAFGLSNRQRASDSQVIAKRPSPTVSDEKYQLKIVKIGVDVPIMTNVDGANEVAYLKSLEDGVAHYKGTALPGTVGNSFIFGHSAYYRDKPGNFKRVFEKLDKLLVGDPIIVQTNTRALSYSVTETKIVKDTDFSVLEPTQDERLTLMTCWPPGTLQKRYIIIAKPSSVATSSLSPTATPDKKN